MTLYEFELRMGFKEPNDVFQYTEVNEKFRRQFFLQVNRCLNSIFKSEYEIKGFWDYIESELMLEFGITQYTGDILDNYILSVSDTHVLYVMERILKEMVDILYDYKEREFIVCVEYIEELFQKVNSRFLEHSIGYEFQSNQLIRKDNEFLHSEVIVSTIKLLHEHEFQNASMEFMQAFSDYKSGNLKGAITNAGKSFESTMKIICENLNYSYKQGDPAKKLIMNLMTREFIPPYLQTHFNGLVNTLESGLPTVRNKHSHGDGAIEVDVTGKIVRYALNLCATNIVLLVEIYNEHSE